MSKLDVFQEVKYKGARAEGCTLSRAECAIMESLSDREKRGVMRGWSRRAKKLDANFRKRSVYLSARVAELKRKLDVTSSQVERLQLCLLGKVSDLLLPDDEGMCKERPAGCGEQTQGSTARAAGLGPNTEPATEDQKSSKEVSDRQKARLYLQTSSVKMILEEVHSRDSEQLRFLEEAIIVREKAETATRRGMKEIDEAVKVAMNNASVVRYAKSLVMIAAEASAKVKQHFKASAVLRWTGQFRADGDFKRDLRGVQEREIILNKEDLKLNMLEWLKAQKRVSVKTTRDFINREKDGLFSREGGMLQLQKYGLSIPISLTTTHSWMIKLGCKFDRHKESYYTDGHERPDVIESRHEYIRLKRQLALRQPVWKCVVSTSLTQKEQEGLKELAETGDEAFWAETYSFTKDAVEYIEFHVDMLGGDVSNEVFDDLRSGMGVEGGQYSVRFDEAVNRVPCAAFHSPSNCKCHRKVYYIGQDESVYKAYAREAKEWVVRGVRGLRKKSEGPGEMVSAFQDEQRGFGLHLSDEELETMNEFRDKVGRARFKESPGIRHLVYGKNKEGSWGFKEFEEQTIDVMDTLEALESDKQIAFEVDHSSGHAKYREDGLHVANMNLKFGGKQKALRDTVMLEGFVKEEPEAKMYLRNGKWSTTGVEGATRTIDLKLAVGDTQRMSFASGDPPPFYDWTAEPSAYIGKPKGIKQVLWERGMWRKGMKAKSAQPAMSAETALGSLPDFRHERTALQHTVESRGHLLVLSPKCHPEVAGVGIEYSWGMSKLRFRREINDEIPKHLSKNIRAAMCTKSILTIGRIRRFARKTRDYCRAYRLLASAAGGSGSRVDIEKMRKVCKAHRNIIDMNPGFMDRQ